MTATLTAHADDLAAISEVPARIVSAWADADARAFAEVFTDDGSMILPGSYQKGRPAIEAFMTHAFAGPYAGTRVTGTPFDIRQLSPDTALLLTEGGVLPADADEVSAPNVIRGSWLVVRDGAEWKLAAYQNTPKG